MCGIAGLCWVPDEQSPRAEERLEGALGALKRRGPDDQGSWVSRQGPVHVAVGNTRLAVQDLTSNAHQPMASPNGRFVLAYNGEISNFRALRRELSHSGWQFTSDGDTEVLLAAWSAWGANALQRLEGMYAFAIVDRALQTLTLCRDPFGIKPLYVSDQDGTQIAFGSELHAVLSLMPAQPRLDWSTALEFVTRGIYDEGTATFVKGIRRLEPGERIEIRLQPPLSLSSTRREWWPTVQEDTRKSLRDAAADLRELLIDSVRNNLVSDVPVGIALSGGIDSSVIVGAARALEPELPIKTFSFVNRGSDLDESPWIGTVVRATGVSSATFTPEPSDISEDLKDLVLTQGEPFGSIGVYAGFRLFKLMREQGVVVALEGQGADELFAGYNFHVGARMRSLVAKRRFTETMRLGMAVRRGPNVGGKQLVGHYASAYGLPRHAIGVVGRLGMTKSGLLREGSLRERGVGIRALPDDGHRIPDRQGRALAGSLRDTLTFGGLQTLLRHGDRNSMRFSVESRVPFLDRRIANLALSLPESYLINEDGTSKSVLRLACEGLVPEEILNRKDKIGFATPDTSWLHATIAPLIRIVHDAPEIAFIDRAAVVRLLSGVTEATSHRDACTIWRFANLYAWALWSGVDCS